MDNSYDNLRGKRKGLKGRFKKKPNKIKTRENSDGSETIIAVQSSDPAINQQGQVSEQSMTMPEITQPLRVTTSVGSDGSETIETMNQPIESTEDFDNLRGKRKRKRPMKKFGRKLKRGIKKVARVTPMGLAVRGAKKVLKKRPAKKKSVGEEALKFTKPLVKAMKIGLNDRGLNTSTMSNTQVIEKFYNEFVSKKNDTQSTFEPIPEGFLVNHYLMSADYDTFDADHLGSIADIQTVANVGKSAVNKIKGFLQKRKAAKKARKNPSTVMPKVEAKVSAEAEKVVKQLEKEIAQQQPVTVADNKSNIVKYVIFAVVALVLLVVIVKFVKK